VICTVDTVYSVEQSKEDEVGGACSTYRREEKGIKEFVRNPQRRETGWKT
jgi:hypothetical protein